MCILIFNLPKEQKEFLALKFISLGIEVFILNNPSSNVDKLLKKKSGACLLGYINDFASAWLQFLLRIRTYKAIDDYRLFILSDRNDRNFMQIMLLLSVSNLVLNNLDYENLYRKLYTIMSSYFPSYEKRKYQRVNVSLNDNEENIIVKIKISGVNLLGKVINFSISGLALKLLESNKINLLKVGDLLPRTQVDFNGKNCWANQLRIMVIHNNIVGIRIESSADYFNDLLNRLLLKKISI